ncbi:hypothetical protein OSB04_023787 [Centaurea solstitialis]|uniref:Integrase catalytic domain-containing protein n=1 Tax=Centaurea solstitialis TaxID=347529 RepID=A0AA38SJW3_9ASTR|nr:hypothetical protein OSB04_023787 [Centaurea solstitialis]
MLLINLLKRLQVLHGMQVRVIRSDNGTEFKNSTIEDYLASVGITYNFSAPRTPQQNGVVERKNKTLVEAARTMLNASGLPLTFWAEAVSTACYTQNRSLVVKKHEKTHISFYTTKGPILSSFMCLVARNLLESLIQGDNAIFIGYVWETVAYRVYVPRIKIVVVSTNVKFDDSFQITQEKFTEELKKQGEASPNATITEDLEQLFQEWYEDFEDSNRTSVDIDIASVSTSRTSDEANNASTAHLESSTSSNLSEPSQVSSPTSDSPQEPPPSSIEPLEPIISSISIPEEHEVIHEDSIQSQTLQEIPSNLNLPHAIKWSKDHPQSQIIGDPSEGVKTRENVNYCLFACFVSKIEPKKVTDALEDPFWIEAMQGELQQFERNNVWTLTPLPFGKSAIGTKWVFRNKRDENGVVIRNKARLVAQGYYQEEGIDYEETFSPVA